ncbi:MAG TPA: class I SAM-dependent methyltransferase [Lysobacter sp.]|nr:class I SAM-dependent methyltransferase [Lysobacter sp.]
MITDHYKSSAEDYVIYLLHIATYRFAEKFTNGKRVLDFGCGSGYGSAHIAEGARSVTAVDVAEDAIAYASNTFARGNLEFRAISPTKRLPFDDASFETVLSFQVFEHVENPAHYLSEIRRVLAPGGTLVLVTPDRSTRLLPFQRPWNRWHVREYGEGELSRLLSRHFEHVDVMGMTAKRELLDIELNRCRKVKWMSLPFTLPVMPDRWRIRALNAVHRLRGPGVAAGAAREYPFDVSDIRIEKGASPSVNLVAVAS